MKSDKKKDNWFFAAGQIKVTNEDNEQRVHILLDNNKTANVPLAGVKTVTDDTTNAMIGIQVDNGKVRSTIRSAMAR